MQIEERHCRQCFTSLRLCSIPRSIERMALSSSQIIDQFSDQFERKSRSVWSVSIISSFSHLFSSPQRRTLFILQLIFEQSSSEGIEGWGDYLHHRLARVSPSASSQCIVNENERQREGEKENVRKKRTIIVLCLVHSCVRGVDDGSSKASALPHVF